jgi:hypothetical protein
LANGFIYINGVAFPYPSRDSGLQQVSTLVDSARTADGVMRGERIGRDMGKIELTWAKLTPEEWSSMLRQFSNFTFSVRYIDMVTNDWVTRKFYVGDRSAQPFLVDPVTNRPKYYLQCKANIIDVGE